MNLSILVQIATVVGFTSFIGIIFWSYDPRRKSAFEQAGQIPLDDEDQILCSSDEHLHGAVK